MKLSILIATIASLAVAVSDSAQKDKANSYKIIGYRGNSNMTEEVNTLSEATAKLMTRKININVDQEPVRIARALNGTATSTTRSSRDEAKEKKAMRRAQVKENRKRQASTPTPTPGSTPTPTPTPKAMSIGLGMTMEELIAAANEV